VLVIAGDNLFDSDFAPFVSFAQSKRPAISICVYDVGDRELATQYGLVKIDAQGKILEFLEKPKDPPTTLASMGFYYLPKESLSMVDRYLETKENQDAPGFFIAWLSKEADTFAYTFKGKWFDIGDMKSYRAADEYFGARKG